MDSRLKGQTTYKVIKIEDRLEKTNSELYKKIISYNKTALKLEKARAMTLISIIREEGVKDNNSLDVKYTNVLSEQGEQLCEALENQCVDMRQDIMKEIEKKRDKKFKDDDEFIELECENKEFDREDYLKENANNIIKGLENNNQIDKERKKHELKNLREALEYNEDDYKRRIRELLYKRMKLYPEDSVNYEIFNNMLLNFHNEMIHECSID